MQNTKEGKKNQNNLQAGAASQLADNFKILLGGNVTAIPLSPPELLGNTE